MFLNLFYDVVLIIFATLALPRLLFQWVFHKKYRGSLFQRLGVGFPDIKKNGRKLIWIHAVSVGETKAVANLIKKMKKEQPDVVVVLSTITETGFAEGERVASQADYHVFLPFDFNWIIKPIVKKVVPDLVVLCETDFWYNFLKAAKRQGAEVALVNGKLSARSVRRYRFISFFSKMLFSLIDIYCLQSNHYRERFLQLGLSEGKMFVTGNLKFDAPSPRKICDDLSETKKKWHLPLEDFILVAGSTHDPEENLLLDTLEVVWAEIPNLSVVVVPRHPERFNLVAGLLEKRKIPYRRYTQLNKSSGEEKVLLLDTMGLLAESYQLADIALVAGSFTPKVGGHNIIEPSWYGVPVLFGPHMDTQPELVEFVEKYKAGEQVQPEDLPQVLLRLLNHPEKRKALGTGGLAMVKDLIGATNRTYDAIKSLY